MKAKDLGVSYQQSWKMEAAGLALGMVVVTWLFWTTDLDVELLARFYFPDNARNAWPLAEAPLWRFFYRIAPWMVALLGLSGLVLVLCGSVRTERRLWRVYGACIFLSVALGPGLIVNAIFKDHWKRPRPRNVDRLGGEQAYVPPLQMGTQGKSFPCGHCSVGFTMVVYYFILRRRYRFWALCNLLLALALGGMIGYGRMLAGGHFLSDIVWSGFFSLAAVMIVYYGILRIPSREEEPERFAAAATEGWAWGRHRWKWAGLVALAAALVMGTLLATPWEQERAERFSRDRWGSPREVSFKVEKGRVVLHLVEIAGADEQQDEVFLQVRESFRGFGFPGVRLASRVEEAADGGTFRQRWWIKGIATEAEGVLDLELAVQGLQTVRLRVEDGSLFLRRKVGDEDQLPKIVIEKAAGGWKTEDGYPREKIQAAIMPGDGN